MHRQPRNRAAFDDDRHKINARLKVDDAMRDYHRSLMTRMMKDNDRFVSRFAAALLKAAAKS